MNGVPMSNPPPLIRKNSERNPMIDLDAMDEAAEEEQRHKTIMEEKEQSRAEHQAKAAAAAPVPVNAKPQAKRKKT
jgi:hypothetical protein